MNSEMLMAGLEFFASPPPLTHNPAEVMYRHDERHRDGRVHSTLLQWYDVAAAARERIAEMEQAQWFTTLPENATYVLLSQARGEAYKAQAEARHLREMNDRQAQKIRRLQSELDAAMKEPRKWKRSS